MFASRDRRHGGGHVVDVAFTDRSGGLSTGDFASLDLSLGPEGGRQPDRAANWSLLAQAFGVDHLVTMRQVHGSDVVEIGSAEPVPPTCDALVTSTMGLALLVRAADCVPVVLADVTMGVIGVVHAGRRGIVAGVVHAAIQTMRERGAGQIDAWVGPHICGGCYEVPVLMRREVANVVPAAFACTTWGSPSLDLGAAVFAQLVAAGCSPVGQPAPCTRENEDFFSYRRQGAQSGRQAGIAVLRRADSVVPPA